MRYWAVYLSLCSGYDRNFAVWMMYVCSDCRFTSEPVVHWGINWGRRKYAFVGAWNSISHAIIYTLKIVFCDSTLRVHEVAENTWAEKGERTPRLIRSIKFRTAPDRTRFHHHFIVFTFWSSLPWHRAVWQMGVNVSEEHIVMDLFEALLSNGSVNTIQHTHYATIRRECLFLHPPMDRCYATYARLHHSGNPNKHLTTTQQYRKRVYCAWSVPSKRMLHKVY
jgi:hypothetical protein